MVSRVRRSVVITPSTDIRLLTVLNLSVGRRTSDVSQATVRDQRADAVRAALNRGVTRLDDQLDIGSARRWSMLAASTLAQAASAVTAHGPAFLIPALVGSAGSACPRPASSRRRRPSASCSRWWRGAS